MQGWLKLHIDGRSSRLSSRAGGGGLLRDCDGNWLGGFSTYLGTCSTKEAELWALILGLRLDWEKNAKFLQVEVASLQVLHWITKQTTGKGYGSLITKCKELLGWD